MADKRPELRGVDLGINLLVSVLVAGGLGYALDRWLGSLPWGMLAGGVLGFGAWLRQMWKVMQQPREESVDGGGQPR